MKNFQIKIFKKFCINGTLKETQNYYSNHPYDLDKEEYDDIFTKCCLKNQLKTAIWIYNLSKCKNKSIDIQNTLKACHDNSTVVKWLDQLNEYEHILINIYAKNKIQNYLYVHPYDLDIVEYNYIFTKCCKKNKFKSARWIYNLSKDKYKDNLIDIAGTYSILPLNNNVSTWLYRLCRNENIPFNFHYSVENKIQNYYYYNHIYDLNKTEYDRIFIELCLTSQIDTAMWIYNVSKNKNKLVDLKDAFFRVCFDNNITVAKWLWQLGIDEDTIIDIYAENLLVYHNSCMNGPLEIVVWLIQISIPYSLCIQTGFIYSSECGQLEIAKWLYQYSKDNNLSIDIHVENNRAFERSYKNGYYEITKWLCSISDKYKFHQFLFKQIGINTNFHKNKLELSSDNCVICKSKIIDISDINFVELPCTEKYTNHIYCLECFVRWYTTNIKKCCICYQQFQFDQCTYFIQN